MRKNSRHHCDKNYQEQNSLTELIQKSFMTILCIQFFLINARVIVLNYVSI